jgi:hypothetical protein
MIHFICVSKQHKNDQTFVSKVRQNINLTTSRSQLQVIFGSLGLYSGSVGLCVFDAAS